MADKLVIPYKGKGRGDDGHKYTSVRLKAEMIEALDEIAAKANQSRNAVITLMLEYCIENAVVKFQDEEKL